MQLRSGLDRLPRWVIRLTAILIIVLCVFWIGLFVHYSVIVERHLSSEKWSLPSTIFAEPLLLRKGVSFNRADLVDYLQSLDYFLAKHPDVAPGQYSLFSGGIRFQRRPFLYKDSKAPVIDVHFNSTGIDRITDISSNQEMDLYEMEPVPIRNLFGDEWEKRTLVPYQDIPPHLIDAVLAIEDRRFFRHNGIDTIGIARALWRNLKSRNEIQGGSTITQQLAKNFFLTPERSIKRKINEALLALFMERRQTKEEILELYLNEIYMGQRGAMSIHGIGEASRVFLRKEVKSLTVPEGALLAGMIRAPNAYNPAKNPKQALERRNTVLKTMLEMGTITKEQYASFLRVPVKAYQSDTKINLAPYFGDVVKTQLLDKYSSDTIYKRNLNIFTSLDLGMQQAAEESLSAGLRNIDKKREKRTGKKIQGCLIAIEPRTGYIKAFVGGRNYSKSQFNRINQALRQPGSVFKPVVYAAAFERAFTDPPAFTPATLVEDGPWIVKTADETWEPRNYDGEYHGVVTLRKALSHSMNIATAKLASAVGLRDVAMLGQRLGFETVKAYPSIALGAFEVSPWHVARAYAVFANGGMKTELRTVKQVKDHAGVLLESSNRESKRVLHPETAYLITDMLRSVMSEGTAASVRSLGFTRPAAGKTGTTDEYRDAWFVGYTPDLLCVVWTGYDDNTPLKMTGAEAALPIWASFMKKATQKMPVRDFETPDGIVTAVIDPTTGSLATGACPMTETELFIAGTEPNTQCMDHAYSFYAYRDYHRDRYRWRSNDRYEPRRYAHKRKKWWRRFKFWD
ncbi:PBP1A family penicillin-binding protein [bacterium]|nr:PBP1A family penicillin-binding protein [bacterium]MCI0603506.1 PBP1A family penicillin-binding protein [bacterium]